ncbi:phosphotransferase family protein [Kineosporia sp. R_H_3]|uniref:phosphotransferase family protein n=1 Tax=Kineosporia sp. R_H_3 TaxID=1961848 RepID=UPI0013044175|nr:aminoglycoside phosphotransferase family protein [Kineosporia sp. R_H_3]
MESPQDGLRERAAAAVRRVEPGATARSLDVLGSGLDHTAFRHGDLVVRVGAFPAWEPALLVLLRERLGWPAPVPRHVEDGAMVLDLLPGEPLLGRRPPAGLAAGLAALLTDLHAADGGLLEEFEALLPDDDAEPGEWLDGLDGPADLLAVVRRDVPPAAPVRVPVHNDLGAEHLLVEGDRLTGVLDWSDAALADPAVDVSRLLRDLGPGFVAGLMARYRGPVDPGFDDRVLFYARCAALEDLAFGAETGRREYVENAVRAVGWLFPG